MPLIVSVMGTSHDEFARLVEGVAARDEVAALELNVSCPNVESGLLVGESPDETRSLLERLRPLTAKPLIVKLTPNVDDPAPIAAAAEEGGADAVSLINTAARRRRSTRPGEPWLGAGAGGLSGAAVRAIALSQVRRGRRRRLDPGGRDGRGRDAAATPRDLIAAGAKVVAVGTESFRDPAGRGPDRRGAGGRSSGQSAAVSRNSTEFFFTTAENRIARSRSRGYTAAP